LGGAVEYYLRNNQYISVFISGAWLNRLGDSIVTSAMLYPFYIPIQLQLYLKEKERMNKVKMWKHTVIDTLAFFIFFVLIHSSDLFQNMLSFCYLVIFMPIMYMLLWLGFVNI